MILVHMCLQGAEVAAFVKSAKKRPFLTFTNPNDKKKKKIGKEKSKLGESWQLSYLQ